jgi:hypothetical protein
VCMLISQGYHSEGACLNPKQIWWRALGVEHALLCPIRVLYISTANHTEMLE